MTEHQAWIEPTAEVSPQATVGKGTRIWHHAQVREEAQIGQSCIVGKGVYIDRGVSIGNRVKIQNGASIYRGVVIEDGVFVGPLACLTNDRLPRAITPDGDLKTDADWQVSSTVVRYGASIGAGAIILPGLTIGKFALIGAGSVVTRDVPPNGLVVGNPAGLVGFVCSCGNRLAEATETQTLSVRDQLLTFSRQFTCPNCGREYAIRTQSHSS
jgi:acetyltransferase-like isoleucine patch superfamily enzyme